MRKRLIGVALAVVVGVGAWIGTMPEGFALPSGTCVMLVIPEVGSSLPFDQLVIATGREGNPQFGGIPCPAPNQCGSTALEGVRYGVIAGQGPESHELIHWAQDPGAGAKISSLEFACSSTQGLNTFYVYRGIVK